MRCVVLQGSPRARGNTATMIGPFVEALTRQGATVETISLHGMAIKGCQECFHCQRVEDAPGCAIQDDMQGLFPALLAADVIVLATPIFTWFCTAEMKAAMDRCFCLSKKYGPSGEVRLMMEGKRVVLATTYGDDTATGPDLLDKALQRLCAYAGMDYLGSFGARDVHGSEDFKTEAVVAQARAWAARLA